MKKILRNMITFVATSVFLASCSSNTDTSSQESISNDISIEDVADTSNVARLDKKKVYASPEWLKSVIDGNQEESKNYKIIEVSWGELEDSSQYKKGHIESAIHLNTDWIESEEKWNYRSADEFKDLFKKLGITKDTNVILYGANVTDSADDRAALAFLWAGVENVKCLDGGLEAWEKAGYDLESGENELVPTDEDFGTEIPAHSEYILSLDEVKEKLKDDNFKLVSIRSRDEFLGKTSGYSYIDRAGEPKGAIWGHDTDDGSYATKDSKTVSIDVLESYLKESSASMDNELAFYCGTGWRASIPFLIAYENGYTNISVYDGGWYEWQMNPELEVQVGDPKTKDVEYLQVKDLPTDKAKVN